MNEELETIKSAWDEKTAAKRDALEAVGRAKWKEAHGEDPAADWAVVDERGASGGDEAGWHGETLRLCDEYVAAHPEEFLIYKDMTEDDLVVTLEAFREGGLAEQAMRVQVWLWHHFEPRHVGGKIRSVIRIPGVK